MDDQTLRPAVGGKEIGYLIEFLQDGVYVTVYPNKGSEVLFELSDVRQTLHDNNVNNYDVIELSKMIREAAGQPRRIADGIDEDGAVGVLVRILPEKAKLWLLDLLYS